MGILIAGEMAAPSPETVLLAVVLLMTAVAAVTGRRWRFLGWWERPVARLARHRKSAILAAILTPILVRVALLPRFGVPEPRVHDEFSYALGGDTLAHGRVVNPPHPMWPHFESEHILVRPVYTSVYPMAQWAVLAIGKVLTGVPWSGVCLSAGLMCGAICWMLQGWLPPRWALLGAILVVLRIGISSYWMNSYWGGCAAGIGGALVVGALPRLMRSSNWRYAATLGVGLSILATSRAVEGAFFGALAGVWLLVWMLGQRGPARGVSLRQVVAPIAVVLGITGAVLAYCNMRTTGKPWLAPYVFYRNTMTSAPHFIWQKLGPEPIYNNVALREFYGAWEGQAYHAAMEFPGDLIRKVSTYWHFYLGPLLSISLLGLAAVWRDRRARPVLLMAAAFPLILLVQIWHNIHYAAPATGLVILVVMFGLRRLTLFRWRGSRIGLQLVRCVPVACAVVLVIQVVAGRENNGTEEQRSWRWPSPGNVARGRLRDQLLQMGGPHLVLVRYGRRHEPGDEWVYNDADIDGSRVVWARELDRGSNATLLRYYSGRRPWLVEPDDPKPHLTPYWNAPESPMQFVPLGVEGIAVLRSADEVRRLVLKEAGDVARALQNCDVWNFYFTRATGVSGAEVLHGCYSGSDRSEPVSFDHWFEWLKRQRE